MRGRFTNIRDIALILTATLGASINLSYSTALAAQTKAAIHAPYAVKRSDVRVEEEKERRWDDRRSHLLDLIFPNSSSWTRFQDLPLAFNPQSDEAKISMLMHAMARYGMLERMSYYAPSFRQLNLGKSQAIIYVGDVVDAEGLQTVVWPHYSGGPPPSELTPPWGIRAVRIKQGSESRFTGIEEGCCADQSEAFVRSDLLNPDGAEIVRSSKLLEYPEGAIDVRFPFSSLAGFTMRFSPATDDAPSSEPDAPLPAIGNIARKYCCDISDAYVISAFVDKAAKHWLLIKLTDLDDMYSTYADPGQAPVDIGWIDASTIKIAAKPENKPLASWLATH